MNNHRERIKKLEEFLIPTALADLKEYAGTPEEQMYAQRYQNLVNESIALLLGYHSQQPNGKNVFGLEKDKTADTLNAKTLEEEKRLLREYYQPPIRFTPPKLHPKILPRNCQYWLRREGGGVI